MNHTLEQLLELGKTEEGESQLKVILAELSGWRYQIRFSYTETPAWLHPNGTNMHNSVPDFPRDLNACHEAASFLRNSSRWDYAEYHKLLENIVARFNSEPEQEAYHSISVCDATALQRTCALILAFQPE